jgi:hypothetical protein
LNPYTHVVIASELASLVRPASLPDYYWGAVAPDARYLAALRRERTHLSARRILGYVDSYPHLESFLRGYLVHCLADRIELGPLFYRHLPFRFLKRRLSQRHLAVLLELYCLERRRVQCSLSGTHNEVLDELGLSEPVSARYAQFVGQYVTPSSASRLADLAHLLGLENDARVEAYLDAAESLQRNRLLKRVLFRGIRAGRIDEQIVSRVALRYHRSMSG